MARRLLVLVWLAVLWGPAARADVGDPQIRTDHPWYPGELAMSTFDRLFATQRAVYSRVTGHAVDSDQDRALASWLWRNTHFWHGETGKRDLWGKGFQAGGDLRPREYWSGLFAYGFGLCGTTHSQWTAEFEHLLGHARGRGVGAAGHNAFEVFLQGDDYGDAGKWALLDHDLSTVIFDPTGQRLLGLGEIQADVDQWIDRDFTPAKQNGWLVCGLHPSDGTSYRRYAVAEYLAGYAGPPPMVHLRRGERMRRYFQPGLDDGQTFVFWGRNYMTDGIPGPERSRTWVNQPDRMYQSKDGTPHRSGQARYANVEYVYRPDFRSGDYREGVVRETDQEVIFQFRTPYIIAATPPNESAWGIYQDGCRHGLVVKSDVPCDVAVSTDDGRTWSPTERLDGISDLTDAVKGHAGYWIRLGHGADQLQDSGLEMRTVCQANVAVLPRLKDGGTRITYEAGRKTVQSLGPELELARTYLTDGEFGDSSLTFTATPQRPLNKIYASAHVASGSPPRPDVRYTIEGRAGSEATWQSIVSDWTIPRRGDEPNDFWSQSFCYGSRRLKAKADQPVQIRFRNDGGKRYLRAEAHLVLETGVPDPLRVTYRWSDDAGDHEQSHVFGQSGTWQLETGRDVHTRWVEFRPVE